MNGDERGRASSRGRRRTIGGFLVALLIVVGGRGVSSREDGPRVELEALRHELVRALEDLDVPAILEVMHPDVILIGPDAKIFRGRGEVEIFLRKQGHLFKGFHEVPGSPEPVFSAEGRAAVVGGEASLHYDLMGQAVRLNGSWLMTLVREEEGWRVLGFQFAPGLFDNPLLDSLGTTHLWTGGIFGLIGLILGAFLARILGARRPAV